MYEKARHKVDDEREPKRGDGVKEMQNSSYLELSI